MIRFKSGALLLLALLLAAPAAPIAVANLNRLVSGQGVEPLADNLIIYALLLLLFGAGAATTLGYFTWRNIRRSNWDVIIYALVAAAGSAALTTLLDVADDYFTPQGSGWFLTGVGLLFGTMFGATFRALCELLPPLGSKAG